MPPRGRPRAPRASRGDRHGGAGGGRGRGRAGEAGFSGPGVHSLTLAEEALNTERRQWGASDQKLRHSKVNFVSAGAVDPLPDLKVPDSAFAGMTLDSPAAEDKLEDEEEEEIEVIVDTIEVEVELEEESSAQVLPAIAQEPEEPEPQPAFFIDTQGSVPIHTGIPPPRVRDVSPTPSNSSEEVILFTGRNNQGKGKSTAEPRRMGTSQPARTITDPIDAKIKVVDEMIEEKKELLRETLLAEHHEESSSSIPQLSTAQVSLKKKMKASHSIQYVHYRYHCATIDESISQPFATSKFPLTCTQ